MSDGKERDQAYWESHLESITREGIGTKAYAQREGIAVSSLYYWRRRLKVQCHGPQLPTQSANATAARLFVPVSMDAGRVPVNRYILSLGCDLRLELPGLPSPQWLAQVSQALQGQAR
jgi:hypothetical protein